MFILFTHSMRLLFVRLFVCWFRFRCFLLARARAMRHHPSQSVCRFRMHSTAVVVLLINIGLLYFSFVVRAVHFISFVSFLFLLFCSLSLLFFSLSPFDFMILFKWFFTQYILLFTYSSAYGFELWKLGTWPAANDNKCALAATTHNMSIFVALYYGIFAGVYMASAMTTNKHRTLIVNVRPRARIKYNWIWLITKWP